MALLWSNNGESGSEALGANRYARYLLRRQSRGAAQAKLSDTCVDLIYIDPSFNSNRNCEGPSRTGTFWGETKEKRAFEDRHASTQAYVEFMCPRCVACIRMLKKTGGVRRMAQFHRAI